MEAQRITIALMDHSAGFEATPDRVRLGDLVDFSSDVATFLRGEDKDVDTNTLTDTSSEDPGAANYDKSALARRVSPLRSLCF